MNIQSIQSVQSNRSNRTNKTNTSFTGAPTIIGNMKMNMIPNDAAAHIFQIAADTYNTSRGIFIGMAPTSLTFERVTNVLEDIYPHMRIGAQEADLGITKGGAVTGAISQDMYKTLGAKFTIIGHSERRTLFGETDAMVNAKVCSALSKNLKPVACVGESLAERGSGNATKIVLEQVKMLFKNVSPEDAKKVVVAYEPVWAINTGKTCETIDAQEMCKAIRQEIAQMYDTQTAKDVSIVYGGSVNETNAADLFAQSDIDGGLIGGASLVVEKFVSMVKSLFTSKGINESVGLSL